MICSEEALKEAANGKKEFMVKFERVLNDSICNIVIQHLIKDLKSHLTEEKTTIMLQLIQCVKKYLGPIRQLLESASFWMETTQEEQEYTE